MRDHALQPQPQSAHCRVAPGGSRRSASGTVLALPALLTVFAALLFVPIPSIAHAGIKAPMGEIGSPPGHGNGQVEDPTGVAVNRTGAGGVSAGDVYVVDSGNVEAAAPGNNRIEEFSASGAFVRAWGIDVVASGPDNISSSAFEVCLSADECKAGSETEAAGGMRKPEGIAIDQGTGTVYVADADINPGLNNRRINVYSAKGAFEGSFGWHVNATTPEEKLQFCTTVTGCQKGTSGGGSGQLSSGSPHATVAVDPTDGHLFVSEGGQGGEGNFRIEEFAPTFTGSEVTGVSFVKAVGWDVVASGPDQADEAQLVRVKAGAGKFKLEYKGEKTAELAFNAPATEAEEKPGEPESIEKALNALAAIAADGFTVTVAGGPGDPTASIPYKVTLHSSPKGKDAAQLVGVKGSLSGGNGGSTVSVETYNDGGVGLESCVAAHPLDVCQAGTETPNTGASAHLGQFSNGNPTSVTVDSSGALYAVNQSSNFSVAPSRVLKFAFPTPGEVEAKEFAPAELTQASGTPIAVSPTDVAVDRDNDNVVVAKKEGTTHYKFLEFDSEGHLLFESPPGAGLPVSNGGGLAIGNGERFYFTDHLGAGIILGPSPPPSVCCVTVSEVGPTTATFKAKVTPAAGFETGYRFEYSPEGKGDWTPFPSSDATVGDGSGSGPPGSCPTNNPPVCDVEQTIETLQPNTSYEVRLAATDGSEANSEEKEPNPKFTTEPGPPSISATRAEEVAETSAKLAAEVNPNGLATAYRFEWGTSESYGNRIPAEGEFSVGSGGKAIDVSASLEELDPDITYHFRIVASNEAGQTEAAGEFTTLDSFGLPDAREPEQVSANDKRPVGMVAQLLEGQIRYQAASDGNSVIYPVLNGLADATGGGNVEYLGSRAPWPSGWPPTQLTPPALVSPIALGLNEDGTGQVKYASADLSCQLIQSFEPLGEITSELEDDVAKGVTNLFRRNADGTYVLLSSQQPLNFESRSKYHVDWASSDCNHVLFDTAYRLLPEAPASHNGLYEWDNGTLRLAGVLPDGSISGDAVAGLGEVLIDPGGATPAFTNVHSLSADGSKVFFTAKSNEGADSGKEAIFVREDGATTVDASQSQTATADKGARYAMASADGSAVFFLANYGLASNGGSSGASSCNSGGSSGGDGTGCDLYEYDTTSDILTDLSDDANPADEKGASVVGVLDASNDGSHVYFAARGQLIANKGKTEAQNLQGNGAYNVYLDDEGALTYVGPIASADADTLASSGSDLSFRFGHWVADATPDGSHLLFISKANVTGYDSGGVAEVYLYSAGTGTTTCLSCRANGEPSDGSAKTAPLKQVTQEEFPALTDVQNRPRSISDDGRHVFFTMPDVLTQGAKPETHNIYEWSAGQLYLLVAGEDGPKDFTEYEDSSASGKDVFLVTKARLAPQDFDATTDLYDLRAPHVVGEAIGPGPAIQPPPICNPLADECQETPTPQPGEGPAAGSEGANGAGNPVRQKPKKPSQRKGKGKHKKHHKKLGHDKRGARR